MRIDIPKIHKNQLPTERFLKDFYIPERPVIVSGFEPPSEALLHLMMAEHETVPGLGFVGSPCQSGDSDFPTPEIVRALLTRDDVVVRPRPLRLWLQKRGHHTMLHYDGNSLHGLNFQVQGKKQWLLISPDTPPRLYPFLPYALIHEQFRPDPAKHRYCEFQTEPGDILFVPRYWFHAVTALNERTANLNWVWTPRSPNLDVAVGRRECAVMAWRHMIPGLSRALYRPTTIHNYGGGGEEMLRTYTGALNTLSLLKHLFHELSNLPWLPCYHRIFMRQIKRSEETLI